MLRNCEITLREFAIFKCVSRTKTKCIWPPTKEMHASPLISISGVPPQVFRKKKFRDYVIDFHRDVIPYKQIRIYKINKSEKGALSTPQKKKRTISNSTKAYVERS